MLKILHIFLLFVFLINNKNAYANNVFYDSFNVKDEENWFFNENDGQIVVGSSLLQLDSNGMFFPYVLNKRTNIFPESGNFTVEIKFQFPHVDYMGDGIGIGFTSPISDNNFFQFQIWRGRNDGFLFVYNDFNKASQGYCKDFSIAKNLIGAQYFPLNPSSGWHILKIKRLDTRYEIFVDETKIYTTKNNQCVPKNLWFGNRVSGGSTTWTSLEVDYIKVSDEKEQSRKIIIIPGLGASWNSDGMVYNQNVSDNDWKMTPFVKNYDGLISSLENSGLIKNQDFYVWNYDWRRSVEDISNSLNDFINLKVGESEKVDLVGHSLGGLTARIWAKNNINNPKLGKIITIAAPDKGAVDAYEVWNGGQLTNNGDISSVGLNVLLQLQKIKFRSNLEAIRNFAPVLKDMVPVFDFIKKNNSIVSLDKLAVKNNYLTNTNTFNFSSMPEYKSFMGISQNTKEWINLKDRTTIDSVLEIWPDGRPNKYSYGNGDGTVLRKSTIGLNVSEINSNHGNIVNKSTENVLSELGVGGTFLSSDLNPDIKNSLIFFVGSPVDMKVKCGNNEEIPDEDGFVVIKDENYQNCTVNLMGTGNGKYHLVTGRSDGDNSWRYYENNITNGEIKNIIINAKSGELESNSENTDFLYKLILDDTKNLKGQYLNSIYLNNIENAISNRNLEVIMKNIFDFRKSNKDVFLSKRIISNIESLLSFSNKNCSKSKSWLEYTNALKKESLIDNKIRLKQRGGVPPSQFAAMSFDVMDDLIKQAKKDYDEGNYGKSLAKSILALKYSMEI